MINFSPIAYIKNTSEAQTDSNWGKFESEITLTDEFAEEAFEGIEEFSHLEIIFLFDKVEEENVFKGSRHPRDNKALPLTGIFAQRGKDRPNRIGATIVELVSRKNKTLIVRKLDALNGTPVLDIKPVMKQFLPGGNIRQPDWTEVVMKDYW